MGMTIHWGADREFKPPVQADPCSRNRPDGEREPSVERACPANPATRKPRPTASRPRYPCPHPETALPARDLTFGTHRPKPAASAASAVADQARRITAYSQVLWNRLGARAKAACVGKSLARSLSIS